MSFWYQRHCKFAHQHFNVTHLSLDVQHFKMAVKLDLLPSEDSLLKAQQTFLKSEEREREREREREVNSTILSALVERHRNSNLLHFILSFSIPFDWPDACVRFRPVALAIPSHLLLLSNEETRMRHDRLKPELSVWMREKERSNCVGFGWSGIAEKEDLWWSPVWTERMTKTDWRSKTTIFLAKMISVHQQDRSVQLEEGKREGGPAHTAELRHLPVDGFVLLLSWWLLRSSWQVGLLTARKASGTLVRGKRI